MRRILAALVALIMCLALSACGASNTEPSQSEADLRVQAEQEAFEEAEALIAEGKLEEAIEAFSKIESYKKVAETVMEREQAKEQAAFDKADALLSEDKYEEAIEAFSEIGSYKRVADKIAEASAKKEEAERLAAEAAEAARPRRTVKITKDNWTEYFEIVKAPFSDAFGNLQSQLFIFRPLKSIKDKIDYDSEFTIDVKHKDTYKGEYTFKYNAKTDKISDLKVKYAANNSFYNTRSYTNKELKWIVDAGYSGPYNEKNYVNSLYQGSCFNDTKGSVLQVYKVEVVNIKGSLVLFDS